MNRVSTRLNKEVEKELDRMKNVQGISKSEIIRKIVEEYFLSKKKVLSDTEVVQKKVETIKVGLDKVTDRIIGDLDKIKKSIFLLGTCSPPVAKKIISIFENDNYING